MNQFTNLFQVHKTVKFDLRPIGKTAELINSNGFLVSDDKEKAMAYQVVKCLIDDYYQKEVIAPILDNIKDNKEWNGLLEKYDKAKDGLERNAISKKLAGVIDKSKPTKPTAKALYTPLKDYVLTLKNAELQLILKDLQYDEVVIGGKTLRAAWNKELKEFVELAIDKFKNFTPYFETLATNIEQVFSGKKNGVAHRMVYQNLYTFIRNKKALDDLKIMVDEFSGEKEMLVGDFSYCLHQSGIDKYNKYIGQLVQRLKEYSDAHPKFSMWHKRFKKLNKQILSPQITPSWLPAAFTNDEMMVVAIRAFVNNTSPYLPALEEIIRQIATYDDHIFIYRKSLRSIAAQMTGDYTALDGSFEIPKSRSQKESLSLRWMSNEMKNKYFLYLNNSLSSVLQSIKKSSSEAQDFLNLKKAGNNDYRRNNQASVCILRLMESYKQLYRLLRPLTGTGDEDDRNEDFYGDFMPIVEALQPINNLFDSVRNWLTKASFSNDSYPVYLGKATLLDNWTNKVVFLKKDGKYFFLMLNGIQKDELQGGSTFDTIVYLPYSQAANRIDANLTRQFVFSKKPNASKGRNEPTMAKFVREHKAELAKEWERIKDGKYKVSDNKEEVEHAIRYFQKCLNMHPDYKNFDFGFLPAEEYDNYTSFVESLKGKLFRIEEKTASWECLIQLVEEGKVYLFQLYNKDYADNRASNSTSNLHTLYWESIYCQKNLLSYDFKLEEPKLYFREKADVVQKTGNIHSVPLRYQKPKIHIHIPILMNANARKSKDLNQLVLEQIQNGYFSHIIGIDRGERNLLYYSVLDMNGNIVEQNSLNIINGINYHEKLMEKEVELDDERKKWKVRTGIRKLKEGYLGHAIHQLTNLIVEKNAILVLEDLSDSFKRDRQKIDMQIYQLFEKMLIEKLSFMVSKNVCDVNQEKSTFRALQLADPKIEMSKTGIKQNGIVFFVPPEYTSAIDPVTGFCNLFDRDCVKDIRNLFACFKSISYNSGKDWFEFKWDYHDVVRYTRLAQCATPYSWVACSFGNRIEWSGSKSYHNLKCENVSLTSGFKALLDKYRVEYRSGENLKELFGAINKKDDIKELKRLFFLTLSLRNKPDGDTDYILSPVQDVNGAFFDSRSVNKESLPQLPENGDANGAYNIARKGLLSINKLNNGNNEAISIEEWIQSAKYVKIKFTDPTLCI